MGLTLSKLTAEDRWDIHQALSYYGHLVDNGEWEGLGEIFTADVELETPLGPFTGVAGVRDFESQAFPDHAPSHHTVNTIIRAGETAGTAVAWSRFVLVTYEATVLGGDYVDTLVRQDSEWKISARRITERNRTRPGGEYATTGAENFASWRDTP